MRRAHQADLVEGKSQDWLMTHAYLVAVLEHMYLHGLFSQPMLQSLYSYVRTYKATDEPKPPHAL